MALIERVLGTSPIQDFEITAPSAFLVDPAELAAEARRLGPNRELSTAALQYKLRLERRGVTIPLVEPQSAKPTPKKREPRWWLHGMSMNTRGVPIFTSEGLVAYRQQRQLNQRDLYGADTTWHPNRWTHQETLVQNTPIRAEDYVLARRMISHMIGIDPSVTGNDAEGTTYQPFIELRIRTAITHYGRGLVERSHALQAAHDDDSHLRAQAAFGTEIARMHHVLAQPHMLGDEHMMVPEEELAYIFPTARFGVVTESTQTAHLSIDMSTRIRSTFTTIRSRFDKAVAQVRTKAEPKIAQLRAFMTTLVGN